MHKAAFVGAAFLVLSLAIAGPLPAQDAEYVMEVGTVAPPGSPWADQLKDFKKQVQEATNVSRWPGLGTKGSTKVNAIFS